MDIISLIAIPISKFFIPKDQIANRLGKNLPHSENPIWIHCASMGEINAIKPFIEKFRVEFPEYNIVISTMTKTGQSVAKSISDKIGTFYFPIDTDFIMRRVFNNLQPKMVIIAETELWPNLLNQAKLREIPVEIINARISKPTFKRYYRTRLFWKPLIKKIRINAKSQIDADRFSKLGYKDVINAQNLKFCLNLPEYERDKTREELGFSLEDKILVWGSSRPGEELLVKSISEKLFEQIDNLKIVLAPRHLSRVDELFMLFPEVNLFSDNNITLKWNIVDRMGVLTKFYAIADLAIIGGSFYDFGGHNPLEAAYYGVPTIIGEYHHSCQDSVQILQKNSGILVSDKNRLCSDIVDLIDSKWGDELGSNGKIAITKNRNSMQINLQRTRELLK